MKKLLFASFLIIVLSFNNTNAQVVLGGVTYSHFPYPFTFEVSGVMPNCGEPGFVSVDMLTNTLPAGSVFTVKIQNASGFSQTYYHTTVSNGELIAQNFSGIISNSTGVNYTVVVSTPKIPAQPNDDTYLAIFDLVVYSTVSLNATISIINSIDTSPPFTGEASLSVLSGTPPYIYTWTTSPDPGNVDTAPNLAPGNYSVSIIDANGCDTTIDFQISMDIPSKIVDRNIEYESIAISPNPVKEFVNFKISTTTENKKYNLTCVNYLGQQIGSYVFTGKEYQLNTQQFSPGMYYYRLSDRTGNSYSGKLMVE